MKDKSETTNFIIYNKCIEQSFNTESVLKEMAAKNQMTLTFETDTTIQKTLGALSGLGRIHKPVVVSDTNRVFTTKSSKKYNVSKKDKEKCCISGICETSTGDLLITDICNKKLKLLDQTYRVVAHCDLHAQPMSMCSIDSSLVALTLGFSGIYFIRVTNGQIVQERTLRLEHDCHGIAHNQGKLYITSGQALFHYTMDIILVSKVYEDTSGRCAGNYC